MSWAALPVEPACMGKAVGEAGRPLMLCGARLYIITKDFNVIPRMVEKVLKDKMLNDIEIVVINKNLND